MFYLGIFLKLSYVKEWRWRIWYGVTSRLRSKRLRASSSRKLGRARKGMTGKGEGKEGTALTRFETVVTRMDTPKSGIRSETGTEYNYFSANRSDF